MRDAQFLHQKLIAGLEKFFTEAGFSKAVLGLSGGIDSALVAALLTEVLGKGNVLGVLMPSQFSTDHSVNDAKQLAENLGIPYEIIPIKSMYDSFMTALNPVFKDAPFDVTEENLQARIRGVIVMAVSNKQRRLLVNTSNKSEIYVGYGTLYGDMCGSIAAIGDLYKQEVYAVSRYINREKEIIPNNIITKAPSAELHPGQKDSDSLPDYAVLDVILEKMIDNKMSVENIVAEGFDANTVQRIDQLVRRSAFKRLQAPPILYI